MIIGILISILLFYKIRIYTNTAYEVLGIVINKVIVGVVIRSRYKYVYKVNTFVIFTKEGFIYPMSFKIKR